MGREGRRGYVNNNRVEYYRMIVERVDRRERMRGGEIADEAIRSSNRRGRNSYQLTYLILLKPHIFPLYTSLFLSS